MPKQVVFIHGSIGHRMSIALAFKGMSKSDLAEKSGYSKQAVSQVISGRLHGDKIISTFSEILKVDYLWIKSGSINFPWDKESNNDYSI